MNVPQQQGERLGDGVRHVAEAEDHVEDDLQAENVRGLRRDSGLELGVDGNPAQSNPLPIASNARP